jgi:conjugative relaxase-like TrwC/TraI family protein
MLSSAKIGTSSWRYYTNSVACAASEYYLGSGEAPGRWHGRGLDAMGIEAGAVVDEARLESLFARALHPVTGERLGRAWRVDGVTGFDLTFSAPKSVSSLWALADPGTAYEMRAAHAAAVNAALSYLDEHASWSRRGVDGTEQIASGGLAAALFEHRTSRCSDPQLHTHALVVNKVACADGQWRTLDAVELYGHKKSAGMIYQAALRSEILGRTGLVFDTADSNGQSEISGVPKELMKAWSKRTVQIDTDAAVRIGEYENSLGRSLNGNERAAIVKEAVLRTRPAKEHRDAGSLHERWLAEAGALGFDPGTVTAETHSAAFQTGRQASRQPVEHGSAVAEGALRAAAAARAVFSRADVAGQVAALLPVDGRSAAGVVALVEQLTDRALSLPDAVGVGQHPSGRTARTSDARWAGADVLAAEARVLSLAERGRSGGYGTTNASTILLAMEGAGLDRGQCDAVWSLTQDGDFLAVVTAPAGAGKTRMLGTAAQAWTSAGYRVLGLAPSARAAAELATATGAGADTVAKWITEQDRRGLWLPEARARYGLDARSVVVVDEASMANTHDLDTLVTSAARAGAKVVLVGDPAQIGVVRGPGGMLAALANAGHALDLTGVHRFNEQWEADATLGLRRGDPRVLTVYQQHGRVHACAGTDEAITGLHAHWLGERAAGHEVLMMARTHADVDLLNHAARASAVEGGEVRGPAVTLGDHEWREGDLLRAGRNDRRLTVGEDGWVRNGDRYRVTAVGPDGLHVEHLDRGDTAFLPAGYLAAHARYGWATTITTAQGATVDVGLVLVRPGIDREHLYVAMTRGREANHAYVTTENSEIGEDRHGTPPAGRAHLTLEERALDVLAEALARSGAQDAAHTTRARAIETARARAADPARAAVEQAARRAAEPVIPAEHLARTELLTPRQDEKARVVAAQQDHAVAAASARAELAATSRLRPGRRRELGDTIWRHERAVHAAIGDAVRLGREIDALNRQVATDTRDRQHQQRTRAAQPRPVEDTTWREAPLSPATSTDQLATAAVTRARQAMQRAQAEIRDRDRDRSRYHDQHRDSRGRDDAPGIER